MFFHQRWILKFRKKKIITNDGDENKGGECITLLLLRSHDGRLLLFGALLFRTRLLREK